MFLSFVQGSEGGKKEDSSVYWRRERLLWILQKGTVKERNGWSQGKLEGWRRRILEQLQATQVPPGVVVAQWLFTENCGAEQHLSSVAALRRTCTYTSIQWGDSQTHSTGLSHPHVPISLSMCWDNPRWKVKKHFWLTVVGLSFYLKYRSSLL